MGGVRTALYNYLFAKQQGGDFILRIEDTDQNRFVPGAEEYILEALKWCNIIPDESPEVGGKYAPYRQSERKELSIYQPFADQLLNNGFAYMAFDTAEELEAARKLAESKKETFMYGAATRMQMKNSLALSKQQVDDLIATGAPYTIRLKVPQGETVELNDLIRGHVVFNTDIADDKVILKSDGMPTYHLAHIVDDILMEITHAIRGEEWLSSAPAHVLIYQYLGLKEKMPQYAHLPLLLKPDGNGKLSKRDGDRLGFPVFPIEWKDPISGEISSGYREKGYIAEAFVNMLAFLGWNPGTETEIMNMQELINAFSFEHVQKAGAKFNPDKTKWFNEQWFRNTPNSEIVSRIKLEAIKKFDLSINDPKVENAYLDSAINLVKPRVQFENEILEFAPIFWIRPSNYDQDLIAKKWKPELAQFFNNFIKKLSENVNVSAADIEVLFKETMAENGLKPGDVMQLLRVFLTGTSSGVDLFPFMHIITTTECVARIEIALQILSK
jgi:glutamyl-tRNA synthetase